LRDMKGMLRKEAGITLIELMVVLVLAAIVTASIYATFIAQQKSYATQTRVSDIQQNARAALTLMERDLRMAGAGVGESGFTVQSFAGNNITNFITVVHNAGQPDQITVVYAAQLISNVTGVTANTVTLSDISSVPNLGTNGKQYIAFETLNVVYTITGIAGPVLTLNSEPPAYLAAIVNADPVTGAAITGARAYLVKAITYQVDKSIDPSTGQPRNTLERVASDQVGTVPDPKDLWNDVANYITDLQVVWPFNGDNNLLQVTLTGQETDSDGTTRTRQHLAVLNIRN
jgi:prepilin-type N-terminal cleavage/methylation domain-containing protein